MAAILLQQDIPVEEPSVKEVEKRGANLFTGLKRLLSSLKKPKKTKPYEPKLFFQSIPTMPKTTSRGIRTLRVSKTSKMGPGRKEKPLKRSKGLKSGTLKKKVGSRSRGKVSESMKAFYSKKRTKFAKK